MPFENLRLSRDQSRVCSIAVMALVAVLLPVFVGCDNAQDSTVGGRVTMDGKPLDHGFVIFTNAEGSSGAPASGRIQPNGSYLVQIGQSGELVTGEYSVGVSSRAPSIPSPEGGPPTPGELITPEKYKNPSTSGLRYQVREGSNVIDIALASEPADAEVTETPDETGTEDTDSPVAESEETEAVDVGPETPGSDS